MIGFYCFTEPVVVTQPTMRQRVVALDDATRQNILSHFTNKRYPAHIATELKLDLELVRYVYDIIDAIQQKARLLMRGEVIVTPAVLDAEGNVITPAVMNTKPTLQTELATTLREEFKDDFPTPFTTLVVSEIMKWSKFDGTGTFAFYKSQIIL